MLHFAASGRSSAARKPSSLLEDHFLERLERLEIVLRRLVNRSAHGRWASARKGRGYEFVDYRGYALGDDLRFVDWKAYLRLGRLIVRLCREEKTSCVLFLIDGSRSMGFGSPSKWEYALKTTAALSHVTLLGMDHVRVGLFDTRIYQVSTDFQGRQCIRALLEYLDKFQFKEAETKFSSVFEELSRLCMEVNPGLIVVISDFLKEDFAGAVGSILSSADLFFLQVLAGQEVSPSLTHDEYELVDSETGQSMCLLWDREKSGLYQRNLKDFLAGTEALCMQGNIGYGWTSTSVPFEEVIFEVLHSRGLLR